MEKENLKTLWDEVEKVSYNPRRLKEPFGTILFSLPDIPAYIYQNFIYNFPFYIGVPPFFYRYGREFSRRIFRVSPSQRVDGEIAMRSGNRETVVLVHGIFQSKYFKFIRDIASKLFYRYGFNVIIVDTRDHLGTRTLSPENLASPGVLEGEDIIRIGEIIRADNPHSPLYLIGFSYGGGIVLNASSSEKAKDLLAGVIAISPTMILKHAVEHIDTDPGLFSPFKPVYDLFQLCMRLRYGISVRSFDEYLERSADDYGFSKEEMLEKSSLTNFFGKITIPVLLIVSEDDPVIPGGDIKVVKRKISSKENIKVMVRKKGGHIAFPFVDKKWFFKIIEKFIEYSNT
jgi:predicted alpha/beta-fold hydrolase